MKRRNRLIKPVEFKAMMTRGRREKSPLFVICYSPCPLLKFGVVISKKTAKRAVDRNRARRQLNQIVSELLEPTEKLAILFIVKPPYFEADHDAIKAEVVSKVKLIGMKLNEFGTAKRS